MKRIIAVLSVMAIMAALLVVLAMPAFADKGGVKPINYGDCVSHIATGGDLSVGVTEVKDFTQLFAPPRPEPAEGKGSGHEGEVTIACSGYPPGQ